MSSNSIELFIDIYLFVNFCLLKNNLKSVCCKQTEKKQQSE